MCIMFLNNMVNKSLKDVNTEPYASYLDTKLYCLYLISLSMTRSYESV